MYLYIHDTLIPQMLEEMDPEFRDKQEKEQDKAKVDLLKVAVSQSCALIQLGYCWRRFVLYDVVSDNYYVGGNEKKGTIWYRNKFIDQYLLLERSMHRWIQMTTKK